MKVSDLKPWNINEYSKRMFVEFKGNLIESSGTLKCFVLGEANENEIKIRNASTVRKPQKKVSQENLNQTYFDIKTPKLESARKIDFPSKTNNHIDKLNQVFTSICKLNKTVNNYESIRSLNFKENKEGDILKKKQEIRSILDSKWKFNPQKSNSKQRKKINLDTSSQKIIEYNDFIYPNQKSKLDISMDQEKKPFQTGILDWNDLITPKISKPSVQQNFFSKENHKAGGFKSRNHLQIKTSNSNAFEDEVNTKIDFDFLQNIETSRNKLLNYLNSNEGLMSYKDNIVSNEKREEELIKRQAKFQTNKMDNYPEIITLPESQSYSQNDHEKIKEEECSNEKVLKSFIENIEQRLHKISSSNMELQKEIGKKPEKTEFSPSKSPQGIKILSKSTSRFLQTPKEEKENFLPINTISLEKIETQQESSLFSKGEILTRTHLNETVLIDQRKKLINVGIKTFSKAISKYILRENELSMKCLKGFVEEKNFCKRHSSNLIVAALKRVNFKLVNSFFTRAKAIDTVKSQPLKKISLEIIQNRLSWLVKKSKILFFMELKNFTKTNSLNEAAKRLFISLKSNISNSRADAFITLRQLKEELSSKKDLSDLQITFTEETNINLHVSFCYSGAILLI